MPEGLDGLVLLDLPDHDSTEVEHHVEVDRLVRMVDVMVWVLDPQKYADAALHERYLRPLASHAEVMVVTLNHVDELTATDIGLFAWADVVVTGLAVIAFAWAERARGLTAWWPPVVATVAVGPSLGLPLLLLLRERAARAAA